MTGKRRQDLIEIYSSILQLKNSTPKDEEQDEIKEIKETLNKKCKKQISTKEVQNEPSTRKKSQQEENVSNVTSNPTELASNSAKWKCSQCDSTFKSRNKLINHLKKIKENIPVKHCMICPFKSCSRISMLSHMEKSHVRV